MFKFSPASDISHAFIRFQKSADVPQNAGEHGGRQAPGLRVLLAGMIRGEEAREIARQDETCAVRKWVGRARTDQAFLFQQIEIRVEGDASQGKNRSRADKFQFSFEIGQAIANFFRERLVRGRGAADGRRRSARLSGRGRHPRALIAADSRSPRDRVARTENLPSDRP